MGIMKFTSRMGPAPIKVNLGLIVLDTTCFDLLMKIVQNFDDLWNYHGDLRDIFIIGFLFVMALTSYGRWMKFEGRERVKAGK